MVLCYHRMMKIAIVASKSRNSQKSLKELEQKYHQYIVASQKADVIIALGGDGFMLHTLHQFIEKEKPVYGMR